MTGLSYKISYIEIFSTVAALSSYYRMRAVLIHVGGGFSPCAWDRSQPSVMDNLGWYRFEAAIPFEKTDNGWGTRSADKMLLLNWLSFF